MRNLVPSPPSQADIRDMLRGLLAGSLSREEVSRWAQRWVGAVDPGIDDPVVWRALTRLGGVDLRASTDEYLYYDPDFHSWLDEVEDAIDPGD
ncbi:MAG: DNA-binding protein [Actinobacteria bacterium]|nr:DNA-binding protein [Actinomycetota bacterium]